jgi:serine/threonine protein kinase
VLDYLSDGTVLGSGSFADVYLGVHTLTGEEVAIKVIDVEKLRLRNAKITEHLKSEIRIMVRLKHANILELRDVHHVRVCSSPRALSHFLHPIASTRGMLFCVMCSCSFCTHTHAHIHYTKYAHIHYTTHNSHTRTLYSRTLTHQRHTKLPLSHSHGLSLSLSHSHSLSPC